MAALYRVYDQGLLTEQRVADFSQRLPASEIKQALNDADQDPFPLVSILAWQMRTDPSTFFDWIAGLPFHQENFEYPYRYIVSFQLRKDPVRGVQIILQRMERVFASESAQGFKIAETLALVLADEVLSSDQNLDILLTPLDDLGSDEARRVVLTQLVALLVNDFRLETVARWLVRYEKDPAYRFIFSDVAKQWVAYMPKPTAQWLASMKPSVNQIAGYQALLYGMGVHFPRIGAGFFNTVYFQQSHTAIRTVFEISEGDAKHILMQSFADGLWANGNQTTLKWDELLTLISRESLQQLLQRAIVTAVFATDPLLAAQYAQKFNRKPDVEH